MKILLDENIDVRFKNLFDATVHQVFTVKDMDWLGIKNGELLKLLEENHFDVLIAVDKNLPYQQNIKNVTNFHDNFKCKAECFSKNLFTVPQYFRIHFKTNQERINSFK